MAKGPVRLSPVRTGWRPLLVVGVAPLLPDGPVGVVGEYGLNMPCSKLEIRSFLSLYAARHGGISAFGTMTPV